MLNEGTSIQAGFSGLMEGMHESPIQSPYGLKTLHFVTGVIVQSPFACQNTYYTCWNGDMMLFFFFSENAQHALACATMRLKSWPSFGKFTVVWQLRICIFANQRKLCAPFGPVALCLWMLRLKKKLPKFWETVKIAIRCLKNTLECKTSWSFCSCLFYLTVHESLPTINK